MLKQSLSRGNENRMRAQNLGCQYYNLLNSFDLSVQRCSSLIYIDSNYADISL